MKAAISLLEASLASVELNEKRLRRSGEAVRADKERDKANDLREALWRLGVEDGVDTPLLPAVEPFQTPIPSGAFTPLEKL